MSRRAVPAALALVAAAALSGCAAEGPGDLSGAVPSGAATSAASAPASPTASNGPGTTAQALLDALPVRAEQAGLPYDRVAFGYENGFDPDGDGCYTWREVLIRDSLTRPVVGRSCRVSGSWRSPYDDRRTTDPQDLSIDHLVPLAEAWRSGAWRWDADRLVAYGNDLDFRPALQAVTAQLNEDKASDDPAGWLPPEHRCTYVVQWIEVKTRWGLAVDARERRALQDVLDACGSEPAIAPPAPDVARLSGT